MKPNNEDYIDINAFDNEFSIFNIDNQIQNNSNQNINTNQKINSNQNSNKTSIEDMNAYLKLNMGAILNSNSGLNLNQNSNQNTNQNNNQNSNSSQNNNANSNTNKNTNLIPNSNPNINSNSNNNMNISSKLSLKDDIFDYKYEDFEDDTRASNEEIQLTKMDIETLVNYLVHSQIKKIDNATDAIIFGFLIGMAHSNGLEITDKKLENVFLIHHC